MTQSLLSRLEQLDFEVECLTGHLVVHVEGNRLIVFVGNCGLKWLTHCGAQHDALADFEFLGSWKRRDGQCLHHVHTAFSVCVLRLKTNVDGITNGHIANGGVEAGYHLSCHAGECERFTAVARGVKLGAIVEGAYIVDLDLLSFVAHENPFVGVATRASVPCRATKGGHTLNADEYKGYVGVFDSGVGGISILRELVRELPNERFVYFGDSANAPYGEKTTHEVRALSFDIARELHKAGCKAIVIACNTATSAAAAELRSEFDDIPIVGVEPALKPAVLAERNGRVLVMATPMTVRLEKFQDLLREWGSKADVVSVPCEGLAARIEKGHLDAPDVVELLRSLVGSYAGNVDAVVLGCTHYPFVAPQIRAVLGDVPFFTSGEGTARQLRRLLESGGKLNPKNTQGSVHFASSRDTVEELELYQRMYECGDTLV